MTYRSLYEFNTNTVFFSLVMEDVNGCLKVPLFVYMFMMCCGVKEGINLVLILWILINNWRMGLYFPTHVKQAV